MDFQKRLAHSHAEVSGWATGSDGEIGLLDIMKNGQPDILIGVSGQGGLFTEEIIREMARHTERPVVFPLSNPTSRAEAIPSDILNWTDGKALVATGSPFDPVSLNGKTHRIAQSNNTYIFPGIGLGVIASATTRVTDNMFMAAARALADMSPAIADHTASLLPPVSDIRQVSKMIAKAVAVQAQKDGVAPPCSEQELDALIDKNFWEPEYS
jgi:malate dehydrogenase (oxaloacetate-decarboxylating)